MGEQFVWWGYPRVLESLADASGVDRLVETFRKRVEERGGVFEPRAPDVTISD